MAPERRLCNGLSRKSPTHTIKGVVYLAQNGFFSKSHIAPKFQRSNPHICSHLPLHQPFFSFHLSFATAFSLSIRIYRAFPFALDTTWTSLISYSQYCSSLTPLFFFCKGEGEKPSNIAVFRSSACHST